MAKGNFAAEPSMEDILASIRRIIADEDPAQAGAKTGEFISQPLPDEPDEDVHSDDDVLDLSSEEEAAPANIPARPVAHVDMDDVDFDIPTPAPAAQNQNNEWNETVNRPAPQIRPQPVPSQAYTPPTPSFQPQPSAYQTPSYPQSPGLVSAHTDTAVSAAFNSLASAIFSSEPRTIEDLTKDMLKPLLKQWLDDNLPSLVERVVRDEIERVARGGRRS